MRVFFSVECETRTGARLSGLTEGDVSPGVEGRLSVDGVDYKEEVKFGVLP